MRPHLSGCSAHVPAQITLTTLGGRGLTLPVFVVDTDALARDLVEVSGAEAHHAVTVRRLRLGERVLLTDGAGQGAECVVRSASKRLLTAEVLLRRHEPLPSPRLVVVQALIKGDAGEAAVDLMTQVGVDVIVPWTAARSVVSWRGERGEPGERGDARNRSDRGARGLVRWRSTAREAAKQARRLRFPSVERLHTTDEVATLLNQAAAIALHETAEMPVAEVVVPSNGDLVLVVGPEGGLTDEEVAAFVGAEASLVRLGPSVLRASAAGAVAAGVLLSRTDRWR